jgi:hypothetical protein
MYSSNGGDRKTAHELKEKCPRSRKSSTASDVEGKISTVIPASL